MGGRHRERARLSGVWLACPTERASNLRHNAWNLIVEGRLGKTRERGRKKGAGEGGNHVERAQREVCYSEKKTFLD